MLERCTSAQILRPSWLTAGLLLDAASALAKGGQVMFRPQPLHQLPSLGICAHRCSTNVAYRRFADTLLLVGIWHNCAWQSLGNRVATLLRRDESLTRFILPPAPP